MKYDELKRRLDATKSNILKTRKSRGAAGDIADKPSTELVRLRDLKKSLEDRIDTLVAGSDYLKNKIAKQTGKPAEEPTVEPEENETVAEGLDEWTIGKMQYYAGIKK
jgi:septal ring factor EnvC (AmiA/AmiB activator)